MPDRTRVSVNDLRSRGTALLLALAALFLFALMLVAGVTVVDGAIRNWHVRDLARRALLVARSLDGIATSLDRNTLRSQLDLMSEDDRIIGITICYPDGSSIGSSEALPCDSDAVRRARTRGAEAVMDKAAGVTAHIAAYHVGPSHSVVVVVAQDFGFVWTRRQITIRTLVIAGVLGILIAAYLLIRAARSAGRWQRLRFVDQMQRLIRGDDADGLPEELSPIAANLRKQVAQLRDARATSVPTGAQKLRSLVATSMPDVALVLVANREPYSHVRDGANVRIDRPASGLVTGVEPLLRACGGVWVGHGSGNADREHADDKGRLAVPPDAPEYVLRRVWLSEREEQGYYYGFSNEGLWPLCHIAHTRPVFRPDDWRDYQTVNRRFAEAAADEAGARGLTLVQDYHFALVPRELRRLTPDGVVSLFWHIPWPNHEAVGICPWKEELIAGMLGADIVGFHTRYHCLNFLDTAARYLECRVIQETMSIEYQGFTTRVRPYPISIEWPYPAAGDADAEAIRRELGIDRDVQVVVGVDRADYTKGIRERIAAVDLLLDTHPELAGRFVYVQIAAPTRSQIKAYRDFVSDLEDEAARVNRKWARRGIQPVRLVVRSFAPEKVRAIYALGDVAMVTPLHDGMNLVAKEYVGSCTDMMGVLILSIFAGASRELEGALTVNPYDVENVASALHKALTMPVDEQRSRMASMHAAIERNTIYDWSAALLSDLAEVWQRRSSGWIARDAASR